VSLCSPPFWFSIGSFLSFSVVFSSSPCLQEWKNNPERILIRKSKEKKFSQTQRRIPKKIALKQILDSGFLFVSLFLVFGFHHLTPLTGETTCRRGVRCVHMSKAAYWRDHLQKGCGYGYCSFPNEKKNKQWIEEKKKVVFANTKPESKKQIEPKKKQQINICRVKGFCR
jgi:hypothetical protein